VEPDLSVPVIAGLVVLAGAVADATPASTPATASSTRIGVSRFICELLPSEVTDESVREPGDSIVSPRVNERLRGSVTAFYRVLTLRR
jgi:hypothetical protein